MTGFGLIASIFAIFIVDSIERGSVEVVGIASAIYLIAKSIIQLPAAALLDKIKGERDDFWALFLGTILYSFVPLIYTVISTPAQLYVLQFFYGVVVAFTLPSWGAIFTRHIDKNHEAIEWGIYQTLIDLGGAVVASLGGFLAFRFGFTYLFYTVSAFSFVGGLFLLGVYSKMRTGKILDWKR